MTDIEGCPHEGVPCRFCGGGGLRREWGVNVFQNARWVPMVSLGIHIDLHTPTVDLHLPFITVQVGRNMWDGRRVVVYPGFPWNGHTDNCGHVR